MSRTLEPPTDLYGYLEVFDYVEPVEHLEHDLERDRVIKYMRHEVKTEQFVVVSSLQWPMLCHNTHIHSFHSIFTLLIFYYLRVVILFLIFLIDVKTFLIFL